MNNNVKKLMMAAAISGLVGGTTARLQATPIGHTSDNSAKITASKSSNAGKLSFAKATFDDTSKHSCKGKNDCKGQGGCKAGDNGCKGKNSCKGKGGCATDGSKAV
ncbi:MAG: hypothetical protein JO061_18990 [Acidobacteriaceae bacterium]|nr:hypothetical protein [Acidobacteriaceae bacterium]